MSVALTVGNIADATLQYTPIDDVADVHRVYKTIATDSVRRAQYV
jgi:hypothetical protein